MTTMKNWQNSVIVIWVVCLVLNIFAFLNKKVFDDVFTTLFWFFISVLVLVSIYDKVFNPLYCRILIFLVAFVGGFFTHFLYFGFVNLESFYLGFICAIISLSLTFGVGILL